VLNQQVVFSDLAAAEIAVVGVGFSASRPDEAGHHRRRGGQQLGLMLALALVEPSRLPPT
jgi:hypothetical protein